MTFKWSCPLTDPNDPGGGNTERLFGGRNSIKPRTFVREDLQNRVDAHDGGLDPVFVHYQFHTLSRTVVEKYFPLDFQNQLIEGEKTRHRGAPDRRDAREAELRALFQEDHVKVLVIEDFNTTGLNGPVNMKHRYKDSSHSLFHPSNSLTCFLRRNGQSGKTDSALGSAGLGRHTYYMSSRILSKLVLSEPADQCRYVAEHGDQKLIDIDPCAFLFGQSYQKEREYTDATGMQNVTSRYNSLTDEPSLDDPNGLNAPFGIGQSPDGTQIVEEARSDFRLSRQAGQNGTSIIIPFVRPNLTSDSIIDSIAREFAIPIMDEELVVEVQGFEISANNIDSLSSDANVNAYNRFLKAARVASVDLKAVLDPGTIGLLGQDMFAESAFDSALERYLAGDIVRLDLDVEYGAGRGVVRVAVQKCSDPQKGKRVVARRGLILSKYCDKNFTRSPRRFTWVDDDELGAMLRGCESASHIQWVVGDIPASECASDVAERLVDMIRHAGGHLAHLFEGARQEVDEDLFADLLPRKGDNDLKPPPPPPRGPRPFRIGLTGGSTITLKVNPAFMKSGEGLDGTSWRLLVVYDSVKGKGFARKAFRPGSFSMEGAKVSSKGCQVLDVGDCHIEIDVTDSADLKVEVGPVQFDEWADLIVEAVSLNPSGGA